MVMLLELLQNLLSCLWLLQPVGELAGCPLRLPAGTFRSGGGLRNGGGWGQGPGGRGGLDLNAPPWTAGWTVGGRGKDPCVGLVGFCGRSETHVRS